MLSSRFHLFNYCCRLPSPQAIRNLLGLLSRLGLKINLEQVLGGLFKLVDDAANGGGGGVAGINLSNLDQALNDPAVQLVLQILVGDDK